MNTCYTLRNRNAEGANMKKNTTSVLCLAVVTVVSFLSCTADRKVEPSARTTNGQSAPIPEHCLPKTVAKVAAASSWLVVGSITSVGSRQMQLLPVSGEEGVFDGYWVVKAQFQPEAGHFVARETYQTLPNSPGEFTEITQGEEIQAVLDVNGNQIDDRMKMGDCWGIPENRKVTVGRWAALLSSAWGWSLGTTEFTQANEDRWIFPWWLLPVDDNDNVDLSSLSDEPKTTVTLDELEEMVRAAFEANP